MRSRRARALLLSLSLVVASLPTVSAAGREPQTVQGGQQGCSSVEGLTQDASGAVLPNRSVRLRNAQGVIRYTETSNASGQFRFANAQPGDYLLEMLGPDGAVIGTLRVNVSEKCVPIAGLVLRSSAGGAFFGRTAGKVLLVAIGAGVVTGVLVANKKEASPSN